MKKFKNYKERINHFINESNEMVQVKAPKVREEDYDKKSLVKSTTKRRSPLFDKIELILPSKPPEDDINPFDKIVPRSVNKQGPSQSFQITTSTNFANTKRNPREAPKVTRSDQDSKLSEKMRQQEE